MGNNNYFRQGILVLVAGLTFCPATSFAHPMGNFSINHYAKIKITQRSIEIRYLIDMAEIPAFQEIRQFDIAPTGDGPSVVHYLEREAQLLKDGISLVSDGQLLRLTTTSRRLMFADGAGGLPTMRIEFAFRGKADTVAGAHRLSYSDNN